MHLIFQIDEMTLQLISSFDLIPCLACYELASYGGPVGDISDGCTADYGKLVAFYKSRLI